MKKQSERQEFNKKQWEMTAKGIREGTIVPYTDTMIDRLRPFSFGGLPLQILLCIDEMCNGKCYDRSKIMSLAFDDCRIIHADVESLRVNSKFPEHSYLEVDNFEGTGETYVVDTSVGLCYKKSTYEEMEKPKVNQMFSKQDALNDFDVQQILASDFEQEKYSLVLTLPAIEAAIRNSKKFTTCIYQNYLLEEIEKLKKAINFDAMAIEEEENMKLFIEDPKKLDEKFKIKRDKYGNEISRDGVPNDFYHKALSKSYGNWDEKAKQEFAEHARASHTKWTQNIVERASKRLEEIKENPTQNIYS